MNTNSLIKKFISRGAIIYTVISVGMMLLAVMSAENPETKILSPGLFLLIALFSYVASLGSTLYESEYFTGALARLVHAVCYNLGFFAFLLLAGMEFAYSVILTVVFAIIYTAAVIISNVFKKSSSSKKDAKKNVSGKKQTSNKKEAAGKKEKSKPQSTYTNRFS